MTGTAPSVAGRPGFPGVCQQSRALRHLQTTIVESLECDVRCTAAALSLGVEPEAMGPWHRSCYLREEKQDYGFGPMDFKKRGFT